MIKAKVGPILVLGVEERNVAHLKAGHPILVDAKEISGFGDVKQLLIFYGETTRDVYDEMNHALGGALPPFEQLPTRVN